MKWYGRAVTFLALSLCIASNAHAVTFPPKPANSTYIVDEANVISADYKTRIDAIAAQLFKDEKVPLIVVTIPSLVKHDAAGQTVDSYATQLFNRWGIGSKDRNYGILMLVSIGDRSMRIEFGEAWQHAHDSEAKTVIDSLIIPHFKQGDYAGGIYAGVQGIDSIARGLALPKPQVPKWLLPALIGGFLLTVGVIVSLFRSGKKGWGWALIAALGAIIAGIFFLSRFSGGGGGRFRGGRSGGGGASGSW